MSPRRWDFISENCADFGVKRICRVMGVSRAGYYRHLATEQARRAPGRGEADREEDPRHPCRTPGGVWGSARPERQARYWIDVARAFDQWGKPDRCYRALLAAEHAAPQEVRRESVRTIAAGLMQHDRTLPGVRAFATRIQALT